MAEPAYIGSRRDEVEAMLAEIGASLSDRPPHLAPPFTGTDSAEAVDARYVAAGQVGELPSSLRADRDAMEHQRQSRLQRWQEQR